MRSPFRGRPQRRAWRRLSLVAASVSLLAAVPAAHAEGPLKSTVDPVLGNPGTTYPDLVPDTFEVLVGQGFEFNPETGQFEPGGLQLYFDTWAKNLGTVALDLMSDDPTNVINPPVSQCVSWYEGRVCRERRTVGGFELHPTHGHFHFNDFARYELRHLLSDGTPDYSSGGLIDVSDKVSFCLVDSSPVAPNADPLPTYLFCSSTREGISAGWADIYTSDLDGQQLSMNGLPDGRYGLVITTDVANHVYESDDTNNRLVATVQLSNVNTPAPTVAIVDKAWPTLGEETCTRPGRGKQDKPDRGKGRSRC